MGDPPIHPHFPLLGARDSKVGFWPLQAQGAQGPGEIGPAGGSRSGQGMAARRTGVGGLAGPSAAWATALHHH